MSIQDGQQTQSMGKATWLRVLLVTSLAWLLGLFVASSWEGGRESLLPGRLEAHRISIVARQPASLAQFFVQTGQAVRPGDPLVRLHDAVLEDQLTRQRHREAELAAELARVQAAGDVEWEWRQRELATETFQTRLQIAELTQRRLNCQVEQLAWEEQLSEPDQWASRQMSAEMIPPISLGSGAPSLVRLQALLKENAAATAIESLSAQLALCDARLEQTEALQAMLEARIRLSLGEDVVRTRLEQARADRQRLEQQQAMLTLSSPGFGVVGAIDRQCGDLLEAGQPIVEVLDQERRSVVVDVPSTQLDLFRQGGTVRMLFPNREWRTGVIQSLPPAVQDSMAPSTDDTVVIVRLSPQGKLWPVVPIGSRVQIEPPLP
jgi:multidrug resistance efflux pump